uniref:Disease resistance RPP13-like protein 1 n=1 Tax=Vitis vinifera TaxID=29760 RepID=F6HPU8_VITVI
MKQFSDAQVKKWLVQVKDAVYHAEDLLDEIATDALRCEIEAADSQTGGTHQAWNWNKVPAWVKAPFATQSMESRMKEMITKLETIAQEKVGLGLKEGGGEKPSPRLPSSSLVGESSIVYGRDEIKEEMVNWLLSDNARGNNIEVMSIVGMGGSGKTTLSQYLYNHATEKEHFDLKAWVCVSTEFLLTNLTKTILEEIGSTPPSSDNINLLQRQLEKSVGNKKLLLVLDDVWDVKSLDWESWDRLGTPLRAAAEGSKIVVTTRIEIVAKLMGAVSTHRLGELSPEDSWALFTKFAFPNGDSSAYPQLEPIGRKIVDKCQGLPLALKALGTLLYSKAQQREWEDILNSKTWHSQSEIRGRLEISKMENVVGVEDALQANMKDKKYLDELSLNWSWGISHDAIQDDILNRLTPHPNLKKLSIQHYPGLTFPDWLGDGSFSKLVSLQLSNCGNCSTLPPLGQLPCLEHIKISKMSGVVMVGSEFYGNSSSSLHPSFPSLQTLSFEDMSNWEKWLCCGEFPRLQELSIRLCPKLTGELPMHLSSLQELNLKDCPQLLVPTLNVLAARELQLKRQTCGFTTSQTSKIEISDVSQLKQLPLVPHYLYIRKSDSVESLLEEEILQTNMYSLEICDCSFYRSPNKVGLPSTLKSLSISDCTKLDLLLPELFRCHHPVLENLSINGGTCDSLLLSFSVLDIFPRLTDFEINGLKGLEELCISISEGDPTSLRNLKIHRCLNLVYIQLPALDSMYHDIWNCSNLKLLAHTHSSLQKLCLADCPELLLHREGLPSNLRELAIWRCNQLTSQVDWDLQRLTSLTHFTIGGGCEGVELFPKECLLPSSLTHLSICVLPNLNSLDNKGLQQLTSLRELRIENCPELQFSTGSVLQRLISLKELRIWSCVRLQSLTEAGLHHLTTLETLSIVRCPKLQYLTKERLPDSLCSLDVGSCPLLEQRLQFEKGQEWRYISHIPKIVIDWVLF